MNWQIEIARDARKELAGLHSQIQIRISKAILALENNPFPSGCKKLKNRDGFRIRVGDYRVLYLADTKLKRIVIGSIGHRREVYRD
ncbi:MAG: type II toxin-antitoxin system RelE/ParE family toxin [Verrucomicrobia bacterium]|nr:type II toxin-antitoxin system RelE/ParE family toxin [Verrucomicrobiota bacterium]